MDIFGGDIILSTTNEYFFCFLYFVFHLEVIWNFCFSEHHERHISRVRTCSQFVGRAGKTLTGFLGSFGCLVPKDGHKIALGEKRHSSRQAVLQ